MPHILKVNDQALYLGSARVGHIRGPLSNAYIFDSHHIAYSLRDALSLHSRYDIVFVTKKDLFTAKLKGK